MSADRRYVEAPNGVEVNVQVDVTNWEALGRVLAHADSDDQAAFLSGLMVGLYDSGNHVTSHQAQYVAERLTEPDEDGVSDDATAETVYEGLLAFAAPLGQRIHA